MAISDGQRATAANFNAAFPSRTQDTSMAGKVTLSSNLIRSAADLLVAYPGGGQANALQLSKDHNRFTVVASAGDSAKLPTAVQGLLIIVTNAGANDMAVFPATGDQIDGLAANASKTVRAGIQRTFFCRVNGQWTSIGTTDYDLHRAHTHSGAEGQGPKLPITSLDSTGAAANKVPVTDGAGNLSYLDYAPLSFGFQSNFSLADGQVAAANVTGVVLDPTVNRSYILFAEIRRKNSTTEVVAVGRVMLTWRELTSTWDVSKVMEGDDDGVTFSMSGNQLQYVTNAMGGSGYAGTLRYRAFTLSL